MANGATAPPAIDNSRVMTLAMPETEEVTNMNANRNSISRNALALATACALLGGTASAQATDQRPGHRERIVSASVEVEAEGSAILLQVSEGGRYIVTQFCKTDGTLSPGGPPGFPPQVDPPRTALATTGLGKIATSECTSFEPGLAIAGGDSVICDNSGQATARVCTVTGLSQPRHPSQR